MADQTAPARGYTPRGFGIYEHIYDLNGGEVRVQQSSLATTSAVWVFTGGGAAHLDAEQARRVRDALDAWLQEQDGEQRPDAESGEWDVVAHRPDGQPAARFGPSPLASALTHAHVLSVLAADGGETPVVTVDPHDPATARAWDPDEALRLWRAARDDPDQQHPPTQ